VSAPSVPAPRGARRGQEGPPLLVPAFAFAGLTVAGALVGGSGPRPGSTPEEVLGYAAGNPTLIGVGAALLFGSAFPLVVFAATAVTRYRRLGVAAPGPLMGFAGAALAAGSVAVSALFSWTSAQVAGLGEPALAKTLSQLWFATGPVQSSGTPQGRSPHHLRHGDAGRGRAARCEPVEGAEVAGRREASHV
jgi:hypothetical protein